MTSPTADSTASIDALCINTIRTLSMSGFGASAPGGTNMEQNGFTADNIVKTALRLTKDS